MKGNPQYYWTEETDKTIDLYQRTRDEKLFNEVILPAFQTVAETIIETMSLKHVTRDDIQHTVGHMANKIDRYQYGRGRGFSYFTLVAKNEYLRLNIERCKYYDNTVSIYTQKTDNAPTDTIWYEPREKDTTLIESFYDFYEYVRDNVDELMKWSAKSKKRNVDYTVVYGTKKSLKYDYKNIILAIMDVMMKSHCTKKQELFQEIRNECELRGLDVGVGSHALCKAKGELANWYRKYKSETINERTKQTLL